MNLESKNPISALGWSRALRAQYRIVSYSMLLLGLPVVWYVAEGIRGFAGYSESDRDYLNYPSPVDGYLLGIAYIVILAVMGWASKLSVAKPRLGWFVYVLGLLCFLTWFPAALSYKMADGGSSGLIVGFLFLFIPLVFLMLALWQFPRTLHSITSK